MTSSTAFDAPLTRLNIASELIGWRDLRNGGVDENDVVDPPIGPPKGIKDESEEGESTEGKSVIETGYRASNDDPSKHAASPKTVVDESVT